MNRLIALAVACAALALPASASALTTKRAHRAVVEQIELAQPSSISLSKYERVSKRKVIYLVELQVGEMLLTGHAYVTEVGSEAIVRLELESETPRPDAYPA